MDIDYKDFMELTRKAVLYDGIINYIKTRGIYSTKDDILAFIGEAEPNKNFSEDISEGGDNNVL